MPSRWQGEPFDPRYDMDYNQSLQSLAEALGYDDKDEYLEAHKEAITSALEEIIANNE